MRLAFGLVSILVVIGIMAWLFSLESGSIRTAKRVQDQVREQFGPDESGLRPGQDVKMDEVVSGNRLDAILIREIIKGGPLARYYGLRARDEIIEIGPQRVRDINDGDLAKALLQEARQRQWRLVVRRGGQVVTLPEVSPAAPGARVPDMSRQPEQTPLQRQLDAIQKIPGH